MPIWVDVMRGLHKGRKVKDFEKDFPRPQGVSDVAICKLTGRAAQSFCDSVAQDFRVAGLGERMAACKADLHPSEDDADSGEAGSGTVRGGKGEILLDGIWKKLRTRSEQPGFD